MKNKISNGDAINFLLTAACNAGDVVIMGTDLAGIAVNKGAIGDTIAVVLRGIFAVGKTGGLAIAQGDKLYVNTGTLLVTKTNTDHPIGVASAAALAGDATVNVLLVPGATVAA